MMTVHKQLFACLAAAVFAAVLGAVAALNSGAASLGAARQSAVVADYPAVSGLEETARQQRQAAEQLAAWQQDPMGGVVWEE